MTTCPCPLLQATLETIVTSAHTAHTPHVHPPFILHPCAHSSTTSTTWPHHQPIPTLATHSNQAHSILTHMTCCHMSQCATTSPLLLPPPFPHSPSHPTPPLLSVKLPSPLVCSLSPFRAPSLSFAPGLTLSPSLLQPCPTLSHSSALCSKKAPDPPHKAVAHS